MWVSPFQDTWGSTLKETTWPSLRESITFQAKRWAFCSLLGSRGCCSSSRSCSGRCCKEVFLQSILSAARDPSILCWHECARGKKSHESWVLNFFCPVCWSMGFKQKASAPITLGCFLVSMNKAKPFSKKRGRRFGMLCRGGLRFMNGLSLNTSPPDTSATSRWFALFRLAWLPSRFFSDVHIPGKTEKTAATATATVGWPGALWFVLGSLERICSWISRGCTVQLTTLN